MKCLNLARIIAYQNGMLSRKDTAETDHHLRSCRKCQQAVQNFERKKQLLKRLSPLSEQIGTATLPEDGRIFTHLEKKPSRRKRQQYYQELLDFPASIDQLMSVQELLGELEAEGLLLEERPAMKRLPFVDRIKKSIRSISQFIDSTFSAPRPVYQALGILLVLFVFVFVLDHQQVFSNKLFQTREPAVNSETATLKLLSPSSGATVEKVQLRFNWSPLTNASSYNFILLNSTGDIVWEQQTDQSTVTLPREIQLRSSDQYFWQVECLLDHGGTLTSEMASFRISDK